MRSLPYAAMVRGINADLSDIKPLTTPDLSQHRVSVEIIIKQLDLFRARVLSKYRPD